MIPYIGGKSYLSSWIISNFPENYEQNTYCEVFGGGGWVLFKKNPSYLEIYNDLNSDLVNLFKIIRDNYPEFQHKAQWSLHSRQMYEEAKRLLKNDTFLNEIEKALHYAIKRVQAFAGQGGWAYSVTAPKILSGKWKPFLNRLEQINSRLKKVQIECLDYETVIRKYDRSTTLFYLDPPYIDAEHYYNNSEVHFGREDHLRLSELLKEIKGKFVLSYYEHPLVDELYGNFRMIKKITPKHASKRKTKPKTTEVLIMNY